ncbi:hypothetical protein [Natronoglomus mannanivorans]|uniref:Uncharacterized protein n=1 Tax=Natronoglomus mannanivorans TaxID=2979990 RepID=A0AAP2YUU0_9EURY|nr:hypothetical protein [Halobacteria archaeon AArc-xg1-1]
MQPDLESATRTNEPEATTESEPELLTEPETEPTRELFPYEEGSERVGAPLPVASARGVLRSVRNDSSAAADDDCEQTPHDAVGSTACPDCDGETINGAGLFACRDCEWTGTLR